MCSRGASSSLGRVKGSFSPMCSFIRDAILFELRLDASLQTVIPDLSHPACLSRTNIPFLLIGPDERIDLSNSYESNFLLKFVKDNCLRKCEDVDRRVSSENANFYLGNEMKFSNSSLASFL